MHKEDIPFLVNYFISKYLKTHFRGKESDFQGVSERAMSLILNYDWPGNIRELENAIEYAMVSTDNNRIERKYLPPSIFNNTGVDVRQKNIRNSDALPGDSSELTEIRAALDRNRWNISMIYGV